ncbi:arylsulfatase [Tichowtungia aerotolerans]|uniref:Sulfatase-like hydrolase/transferase n=1 Tax=Tichowtungia aerotolerans TaxID=2697043 RepID=A0A6P1MFI6_9BACT|nr:arylsulfatase [Tichowtungia aerotolerans]QHI70376.1 sulfatase-like hydrolase/transferase [Tichowtungia aerotolerans]
MKKWIILLLLACIQLAVGKPNILLVIADDMGFSDLGCYGGEIRTPNIDQLATEGVRFTQFYNCARCWPTRSSIMTGYYAVQTGADPNSGPGNYVKWTTPLPQLMNAAGYRTYHSGKWHVQATDCNSANSAGFDRAYDEAQGWLYYTPFYHALDGKMLPQPKPEDGYFMDRAIGNYMLEFLNEHYEQHADQPFFAYMSFLGPHYPLKAPKEYVDKYDGVYDEGWDVVRKRRFEKQQTLGFPKEWTLSAPEPYVVSPHSPQTDEARVAQNEKMGFEDVYQYTPWEALSAKQKKEQADKMEIHAAMVDHLDHQVGRVISLLEEKGQLDNTIVLFLSDNGADCTQMLPGVQMKKELAFHHDNSARWGSENTALALGPVWAGVCNTPFRRHKIWTHEGGVSTPLIVRWPKGLTLKPGGFTSVPGHVIDFIPTFLQAAGASVKPPAAEAPPFPGKSLLPVFQGLEIPRDFIYFKHVDNRAFISGKWKIVSSGIDNNEWELFDLEEDRTEMNNLRSSNFETLRELVLEWENTDALFRKQGGYSGN